jgi:uncharacterized protein (DUF2345 family)
MTILSRRTAAMLAASIAMLALAPQCDAADDAHVTKAPRTGHHPAHGRPYGYTPIARPPATSRPAPGGNIEGSPPLIQDCVHVFFPQCSGI